METLFEFINGALPLIAAMLTVPILEGAKRLSGLIDGLPAVVKQLAAFTIAFGLTKLGGLLGQAIPTELGAIEAGHLEAALAGAGAWAIYAGRKAAGLTARRPQMLALIGLLLAPTLAACQTGRATVRVIDRSLLAVTVTPPSYTGEVGDTVTFRALAVDTISGDTIASVFTWSSTDPTGVSIEPTTGHATLLRAGTYEVEAFVETIVAMIITRQRDDGSWAEVFTVERQPYYASTGVVPARLEVDVAQVVPLCAYLESSSGLRFVCTECAWSSSDPSVASVTSSGGNVCPTWVPGLPFPEAALSVPYDLFRRGLRVG